MNILLIGSGGREHALAWALSASPLCDHLIITPGNSRAGHSSLSSLGEVVGIASENLAGIVRLAQARQIDFVVIGPEQPLVHGLVDRLADVGILAFGPSAGAARLEGSKHFARAFCARHAIPQPRWRVCVSRAEAVDSVREFSGYCVVKADGLAGGKGVIVCDDRGQAERAIDTLYAKGWGGDAGVLLVEERLEGPECSAFALVDGEEALWFASAQDYKRAYDGDKGPNTGGMGAVSPSPYETEALRDEIMSSIIEPLARGMVAEGVPYCGILYAGLMLTAAGPRVIEFNCRLGDPEAQAILPRLRSDFLSALVTVAEGGVSRFDMRWSEEVSVAVVLASKGYPGVYETGGVIKGADAFQLEGGMIFHSGVVWDEAGVMRAGGGRVLSVVALGETSGKARERAYRAVRGIEWADGFYRTDIAQ